MITQKQLNFEDLPKLSFYRYENFFNIYEDEYKNKFYNLLRTVNIFPANDSTVEDDYLVQNGDTWVYISYKFYNTIELWWLVCEYNRIKNPVKLPEAGKKIKILKKDLVWTVISELNRQLNR